MSVRRLTALACLVASAALAAYEPPSGGEGLYELYSPLFSGGGPSVSSTAAPAGDAINPASQAVLQRFTLDASYLAIIGLASEDGWGNVINLSASIPRPIGVWGAGLRYVHVPAGLASMPLGDVFNLRGTFAKDLYENFWLGIGLQAALGARAGFDWSLGADIGLMHSPGDLSFMKNFRWGLVAAGLGKWYAPLGAEGSAGSANLEHAFPAPFTLKAGAGFDFFKTDILRLSMTADLAFPFFQNLVFDTGLALSFKEAATLSVGWGINAVELAEGRAASLLPSFALSFAFPITTSKNQDSFLSKQGWDSSELRPSISAAPLYGGAWAFGAGAVMPLGVVDRKPPRIQVSYPESPYGQYYLSPNADGKNDELVLPIGINDERYVQGYSLRITDAQGATVREILNKEERPENEGVKGFFDRLAYKKKGVKVPPELRWDGRSDQGQQVADGEYTVVLSAVDDNGNRGESQLYKVAVDATPPSGSIQAPVDPSALVFSPDQDGNKDSLAIQASGTKEDLWRLEIRDSAGNTVRTFEIKDAALGQVDWDGKNDLGQVVPDGVYRLVAAAEDRGRNNASVALENIVIDTRQPPVSLTIDAAQFSPNGDGSRDTLTLSPGVPVRSGLAEWSLAVKDASGAEVWSVRGQDATSLKNEYIFDGKGASGKALPEGSYQAVLSARYVNGHRPSISSPAFAIDITKPSASAKADVEVFSPNGDGRQDTVLFSMSGSPEDKWTAEIRTAEGALVYAQDYSGKPDPELRWDGTDDRGAQAPDGLYVFSLVSKDRAGNSGSSAPVKVRLDTEKKSVMLSVDNKQFSPNGDGVKDTTALLASVQSQENVSEWRLRVKSEGGADLRFWSGKGRVPERNTWNGRSDAGSLAADGTYSADLWVRYVSGDEVTAQLQGIVLDTQAPTVEPKVQPLLFSPDGDGRKDSVSVTHGAASKDAWTAAIIDPAGRRVREYSFAQGPEDFTWDGTDAAGNKVPDGRYRYIISATDRAGNKTERSVEGIVVDTRETGAFVTASRPGFSPNGDGRFDDISFGIIIKLKDGLSAWSFDIRDASGAVRKTWSGKDASSLPANLPWDGKDAAGALAKGKLVGVLSLRYEKGDEVEARSPTVLLDVDPPQLKVSLSPMPFSPDNDGVDDEVSLSLAVQDDSEIRDWRLEIDEAAVDDSAAKDAKLRLFMKYEGQGMPAARVTWDGKSLKGELVEAATDYPWFFSATDSLGNSGRIQGIIPVDVLVIRDGNRLKIKVPSIVFRPNFADFKDLPQETVERNVQVLRRIAEILNKYRTYRVRVEGHANSIGKIYGYSADKIKAEEEKEVLPISQSRAQAVKDFLVQYGVDEKRLSAVGLGSAEPVVDPKDAENRWKNRRVEFILEK